MAISLQEVNKNKNKAHHETAVKEKNRRPWESYNLFENKTRTIKAQEAVRKAQHIVEKNEVLTDELLKNNQPELKTTDEIVSEIKENNLEIEQPFMFRKDADSRGIMSFIRYLFH